MNSSTGVRIYIAVAHASLESPLKTGIQGVSTWFVGWNGSVGRYEVNHLALNNTVFHHGFEQGLSEPTVHQIPDYKASKLRKLLIFYFSNPKGVK